MATAVNSSHPKMDKIVVSACGRKLDICGQFAVAVIAIQTHQLQVSGVKVNISLLIAA